MSISVGGQRVAAAVGERRWPAGVAVPVTVGLSLAGWWVIWQAAAALLRAVV